MSIFITAYRRRTTRHEITLTTASGSLVTINADDVIRLKVGNDDATPLLDLDSAGASGNGSSLTRANPTEFRFAQGDTDAIKPGTYNVEVAVYVPTDGGALKHAEKGVLTVIDTQGGDVAG